MTNELAVQSQEKPEQPAEGHGSPRPFHLAVLMTHPIQYFAPLFKRLAARSEVELTVLYTSLMGAEPYKDPGFGKTIAWDVPLLEGYRYKVLKNVLPGIILEVRKGRYDALLIFGWASLTSWMAFASAGWADIPVIMYGDSIPTYEGDKPWPKSMARRWLLRELFRRTDAFLVTGTFNRIFYQSFGVLPQRCFDAPLAIDNDYFMKMAGQARKLRSQIRAACGIPSEMILVLFVGKLTPGKRPMDVIAAVKAHASQAPELGVAFVGDGDLRASLESAAAAQKMDNVFFLGFKNQSQLPELYSAADIFVLPSTVDHKPLVTNEAMACGLPVVASDRTGVWGDGDLVREGDNGFVYPCGDTAALGRALARLALDSELRRHMGERSLEIIQQFGYDQSLEGILKAVAFVQGSRAACERGE